MKLEKEVRGGAEEPEAYEASISQCWIDMQMAKTLDKGGLETQVTLNEGF